MQTPQSSNLPLSVATAKAIEIGREEARETKHKWVGTEQLLIGLLLLEGEVFRLLSVEGVTVHRARKIVSRLIGPGNSDVFDIVLTPRTVRALEYASQAAANEGHRSISTIHTLLGILREAEGVAVQALREMNIDIQQLEKVILEKLSDITEQQKKTDADISFWNSQLTVARKLEANILIELEKFE